MSGTSGTSGTSPTTGTTGTAEGAAEARDHAPRGPGPFSTRAREFATRVLDAFPFGRAPLIILAVTVVSGLWLLFHPVKANDATLRLWTFATSHYDTYLEVGPSFEEKHPGTKLDIQLVHRDAVTYRLRSAFWADLDVPDLVEVEISRAGSFFRGRPEDVGFVDLKPWLVETGLIDRIVKTRFAPYTSRGRIYGLPHDVHPVMIAYRRDLFEAEGIDASELDTWDKFIAAGRRVTRPGKRYMIELNDAGSGNLNTLLFQRDGGYFDADGRLTMDDPVVVETIKWFVPLVAGPGRIADYPGWGQPFTLAVEDGYILSFLCPDWRSRFTEKDVPRVSGKMALMPLPAVAPGGRRTSTWGGTMIGITKKCRDKELAWKLAQHLYLNVDELGERFRSTNILPPVRDAWDHPAIDEPREYWSGQRLGRMYADLGADVPAQYTSPYTDLAKDKMGEVVSECARHYAANGDAGFDEFVRSSLKRAAESVRRQMQRNPF